MPADAPVTLAVVIGAHGVTGQVRRKVFAEDLKRYKSFNGGKLTLKSLRDGTGQQVQQALADAAQWAATLQSAV